MSLPPHAVAGIDQELASLNRDLDHMITVFRRKTPERGETQLFTDLAVTINASYDPDTRGDLLAAAVYRLARQEQP